MQEEEIEIFFVKTNIHGSPLCSASAIAVFTCPDMQTYIEEVASEGFS